MTRPHPHVARTSAFAPPDSGGPDWTPTGLIRPPRHGDPWLARVGRTVRGVASASHDVRIATELAGQLAQPVTTGRRIAVLSIRGGAGKSTVSTLIGAAFAGHRNDRVLAIDADPDLGSLALRAGAASPATVRSVGTLQPPIRDFTHAAPHLARTATGLWLLTGGFDHASGAALDLNAYRAAAGALARYFAVTITDCGAGVLTELNRGILAEAHALVLVTPATVDGVVSARQTLTRFADGALARLLHRTVVVVTAMSPQASRLDVGRASDGLVPYGVGVVPLPYDRHLATGAGIEAARLGTGARIAAVQVAADALTRAVTA
jgi:MinD-like ATPase involved in chromosome partitioning or flagellar assembly